VGELKKNWHLELEWTRLTDSDIGIWYFLEASFTALHECAYIQ